MKKNVLALSIATAVVGFAGSAHAIGTIGFVDGVTKPKTGLTAATTMNFGDTGVGHTLQVPYYSAQNGNATLLSLINTDTVNGKAVKVRFRGAKNSDDVFDFQVFLSPGDVWTANVSKGEDGRATLVTADLSCTKPATVNGSFSTGRLNKQQDAEAQANDTREGYVEIFNMADIPPATGGLYPLIKHKNGAKPTCANVETATVSNTAWTAIDTNLATEDLYKAATIGMTNPSTGLAANWTIMNVPKALSWSGAANAVEAVDDNKNVGYGNLVYYPQSSKTAASAGVTVGDATADPLFLVTGTATTAPVTAQLWDLPDMSTPYTGGTTTPALQATELATAIAATSVMNEFWNEDAILAETDWVVSMPTRRYAMAVAYAKTSEDKHALIANPAVTTHFWDGVTGTATTKNVVLKGDKICLLDPTASQWGREEEQPAGADDIGISPGTPEDPQTFCGEASVMSFNNNSTTGPTNVLSASVAVNDLPTESATGWVELKTPGSTGNGLPIIGYAAASAFNSSVQPGTAGNFSINWPHRFTRVVKAAGNP